jgi:hypothetical protein
MANQRSGTRDWLP